MENLFFKRGPNIRKTVKITGLSHASGKMRHVVRESLHQVIG